MRRRKLRIVPLSNTADLSQGRLDLGMGFAIDNIAGLITPRTFDGFSNRLSRDDLENLLAWDLCVVHEFQSDLVIGPEDETSELLMRFLVASFRWLRPTQTSDTWFVQGFVDAEETITIPQFSVRADRMILGQLSARPQTVFLEDCEAREGLADPEVFRESSTFLPTFYQVVSDLLAAKHSHVPVVMAARLSEQAYLDFDVQIRLLKRIMALEALFSSGSTFGKRALIPRVQKFLGEATPIYPGTKARYTVATVIEDLCELRNAFAHGEVVPQRFLDTPPEPVVASTNVRTYADILREASAVVLRACLLRIFREGLIETFSDKAKMEALF